MAQGLGDGVARPLDRTAVGVREGEPADGRGQPYVLVGDDEPGAGRRRRELAQGAARGFLVHARHENEQASVLVPAEPVAAVAEPLGDPGEPLGHLTAYPRPEPFLKRVRLGHADHRDDAAAASGAA